MSKKNILKLLVYALLTLICTCSFASKNPILWGTSPSDSNVIPNLEWTDYKDLGAQVLRIHIQKNDYNGRKCYDITDGKFVPTTINNAVCYTDILNKCKELGIKVIILVSYESYEHPDIDGKAANGTIDFGWGHRVAIYLDAWKLIADSIDVNGNPLGDGLMGEINQYLIDNNLQDVVAGWEVWNEQDAGWWIAPSLNSNITTGSPNASLNTVLDKCNPQPSKGELVTPKEYMTYPWLICEVYKKFKCGDNPLDPNTSIIFGGLDALGAFHPEGRSPVAEDYVKAVYDADNSKTGKKYIEEFKTEYGQAPFDAVGHHPYDSIHSKLGRQGFYNNVNGIVNILNSHGDQNVTIWITELGAQDKNNADQAKKLLEYCNAAKDYKDANGINRIAAFVQFKYYYGGQEGLYWSLVNPLDHLNPDPNVRRRQSFNDYSNFIKNYTQVYSNL